jgi:molecular chaperone GrpE
MEELVFAGNDGADARERGHFDERTIGVGAPGAKCLIFGEPMSESKTPPSHHPSKAPAPHATANGNASAEEDEERPTEPGAIPEAKPAAPAPPADPLAEARAETARMKDAWMRSAADFDNFRKRARRELEDARKAGREELLKDLLPVFDNLERGIQSAQQAADVKAVIDGLSMILKQFDSTLGRTGISKVPTIGKSFDPAVHEAIQQVETSDQPPGTIVAEVQPGYMAGERLIRAAMVVVAKPKSDAGADPGAEQGETN